MRPLILPRDKWLLATLSQIEHFPELRSFRVRRSGFKSWWSTKEVRIGGGSALECDERGSDVFRIKVRIKE